MSARDSVVTTRSPWIWVPTLYFTQAIPYTMVIFVSRVFYKKMEVSNAEIAFYVSLLGWPWVIKPLWSPIVDILKTKRWWILITQVSLSAGLAGVAMVIPTTEFFFWSILLLSVVALASATHDIASDGFYMLASDSHEQAFFVGIRSTCWRLGMIACQGLLVIFAGYQERHLESISGAWSMTFLLVAGYLLLLALFHKFALPKPARDVRTQTTSSSELIREFSTTFTCFFRKPRIGIVLAFILLYRFSEAQLVALKSPFFLDSVEEGGLGLSTQQVGWLDGTVGAVLLLAGGILGGTLAAKQGLKAWIWWMVVSINAPNLAYIYLAAVQPDNYLWICAAVAIEQFGYGFGFAGYMLYLLYIARGNHETAHYAICTGFMALGVMVPGMWAGAMQEILGYRDFFIWVMLATIPSFFVCWLIPLDADFGKKVEPEESTSAEESTV
ncbi:MAG: MFS transporter [Planctomycetota bacterium]